MDMNAKKQLLKSIPYGLYVVGVVHENQVNAFTATWLSQCSLKPPMISLGIRKDSFSYQLLQKNPVLSVNFFGKDQQAIFEHFFKPAKHEGGRLAGHNFSTDQTGAPILDEAIAYLECQRVEIIETNGDHAVVIGEVTQAQLRQESFQPIILSDTTWSYGG